MDLTTANLLVGVGTVLLNIGVIKLFAAYLLEKGWWAEMVHTNVLRWGLWAGFILTLGASAMTLYYSEFLGVQPCGWCWMQRAFLYPQVILFLIAAIKKDTRIALYSIWLSTLGAAIALYQHYLQMGGYDIFPCPATGSAADCGVRTFFEFGYITFPFASFSLFALLILMMLVMRQSERKFRTAEHA